MIATVQTLAAELFAALVNAKRTDDSEYVKLADGSPEWMERAIFNAHSDGSMFPDDWRYAAIKSVAGEIAETDEDADMSDEAHERCDGMVSVYTHELTAWLGSRADRYSYCDDAAEEYGVESGGGIIKLMQMGQFAEYREIWDSLVSTLEEEADGREPEMQWSSGWNLPGYMPDSEPACFETAQEARDYIAEEMRRYAEEDTADEYADSETEGERVAAMLREAADECDALEGDSEFGCTVGGYHYWVSRV